MVAAILGKCTDWEIERSPPEKNFGVLVDDKLDVGQQYVFTTRKANFYLDCIERGHQGKNDGCSSLL